MIRRPALASQNGGFAALMQTLGETFAARDVMVPLSGVQFVASGDEGGARQIVAAKRFTVVPISSDGKNFASVFCAALSARGDRTIMTIQATSISDHIPDSTPLAEALFLFENREWYLTLSGNRVSGLLTYWAFNSREFRIQLYAGFSRIEELSRDVLAKDGCGVSDDSGLNLTPKVLEKVRTQFALTQRDMGGNRFVDELQFHEVHDALRKHLPWRDFLHHRLARQLSNSEYDRLYDLTTMRDKVMHGRILFPTYPIFKQFTNVIDNIAEFIGHLNSYVESSATEPRPAL